VGDQLPRNVILQGDALDRLRELPAESVHCCVTSPPYWGLRDYGEDGQLGLEATPEEYVQRLVGVFQEVRRVLRGDGVLWLNTRPRYATGGLGGGGRALDRPGWTTQAGWRSTPGYRHKELVPVHEMTVCALRADGWLRRADVIWDQRTASEPMRADRPAMRHEYLYLLTKEPHYWAKPGERCETVWAITPARDAAHPATMPRALAERCIVGWCPPGGVVLDPFAGSGTTSVAAIETGRDWLAIELSAEYIELAQTRILAAQPVLPGVVVGAR